MIKDLSETVQLMTSEDYKDRFLAEYLQLEYRYARLHQMLENWQAGKLEFTPTCSFTDLWQQGWLMGQYLDALRDRAKLEQVDLTWPRHA